MSGHIVAYQWPLAWVAKAQDSDDGKKVNGEMVLWPIKADHVALLKVQ